MTGNQLLLDAVESARSALEADGEHPGDHRAAIALLRQKIAALPHVLTTPPVDVEILEFNLVGPVLAVRPYCHNDHYWQVYFETNQVLREALAEAGFPAPMAAQNVILNQVS